jgi:2-oxoglutarate dehydrogenase E1 component
MASELDKNTFLTGSNSDFISQLYNKFVEDPQSVDLEWARFFSELGDDVVEVAREVDGPSWGRQFDYEDEDGDSPSKSEKPVALEDHRGAILDSIRALMMIRVHRVRGHLIAKLDPLQLEKRDYHAELDPRSYGFEEADMDREIFIDNVLGLETATVREILKVCRRTYCGSIGVEFMHIQSPEQKSWIQQRVEGKEFAPKFTSEGKKKILHQLTKSEGFERFLHLKYPGTKRFGVDGGETLIPLLEALIKRATLHSVEEIGIGMPHRGRLNVLANIMRKPYSAMFSEFEGVSAKPDDVEGSGDVKYHLGVSTDRTIDDIEIHLSLAANPSHLEAVDPVVIGKTRAKQDQRGDTERRRVTSILMHGDAAFAGQGLVAETLGMSQLKGHETGGTIHVIVNNQIGFTTAPSYSRSSPYPSDVAKMVQAPILHVNGDDPEAVVHVSRIAADFQQEFGEDIVIDMFCYRRHGHNEADEPAFTQPIMYRKIAQHPTARQIYAHKLVAEGEMTQEQTEALVTNYQIELQAEFDQAKSYKPNRADWLEGKWSDFRRAHGDDRRGITGVSTKEFKLVGEALTKVPEDLNIHRTLKRLIDAKEKMVAKGEAIDWATGEALAFGTLLSEGYPVRLSGQDSGRGTFSHRHSVWVDQATENRHSPLNHIKEDQAHYEVIDSMLSEAAVLGFEYGYSLAEPNALVLWEAQFGDFANGAQVIIDQFLSPGESKWLRMSGLVMLLPHGQEGQGPEHSSARLERYLQLCAEDNLQVGQPTTPANYFHILRRQMHRDFRKPLIMMSPKSLLRHKLVVSHADEFTGKGTFHRILWDDGKKLAADKKIKRVVLCSGKVYYDLFAERESRGIKDIQILRLEQLYPFPQKALTKELGRFPDAEVIWCQEEPHNMGAWFFVQPRILAVLKAMKRKQKELTYAGCIEMAAPAPGSMKLHQKYQAKLIDEALTL